MLISDEHEFIFVHIPKTAGSSVRSALEEFSLEKRSSNWSRFLKRLNLPKDYQRYRFGLHSDLKKAQEKLPPELFNQYKKIAFVRNPWDMLVSNYSFKVFGSADKKSKLKKYDFESFIQAEAKAHNHLQSDYLTNKDGEFQYDFLGRFENLANDYDRLRDYLDIPLKELPSKNRSHNRRAYQEYYTDETREFVASHWKKDIEAFAYTFD